MIRVQFPIRLEGDQTLLLIPIGDIHWDTPECDRERFKDFVKWVQQQEKSGRLVRLIGMGDYLDLGSPSERRKITAAGLHDATNLSLDMERVQVLKDFLAEIRPISRCLLGLLTGHHHYHFITRRALGPNWQGRSSDEWLSYQLGCRWLGTGASLFRLALPHRQHLDVLALHGSGGAQTPGGRVQKRIRFSEIAPTAHLVISGHDNAKLSYPRSGLDWDHGRIKRYVIGSGSFQRAYLDGDPEAGYAERQGLVPADLGVTVVAIQVEQRNGKWRVDYHTSV